MNKQFSLKNGFDQGYDDKTSPYRLLTLLDDRIFDLGSRNNFLPIIFLINVPGIKKIRVSLYEITYAQQPS